MINNSVFSNETNSSILNNKHNKKVSHKRVLSYQEIQHSLINLLNTKPESLRTTENLFNSEVSKYDFDNYKDYINNTLEKYDIPTNENNEFITTNDNFNLKKIKYFNKKFLSTFNLNNNNNNDNGYYYDDENPINIRTKRYNNPSESLHIIKNNQKLYETINKNILSRQKDFFSDYIDKYNNRKKNPTKLKVINIPTKFFDAPIIQKKKNKTIEIENIPTNKNLKLFFYYLIPKKNNPECREQFSFNIKGNEIILTGGITSLNKNLSIWKLNVETLEWNKIPTKNTIFNRFGHTANIFQNKIYFFGGMKKYKFNNLTCNFEVFNLNDNSFSNPSYLGTSPESRKNHISLLVGNQIFIYGGINEKNEILNDCKILNLNPLKWLVPKIDPYSPPPYLYGHAACIVCQNETLNNIKFNIYKFPNADDTKLKEQYRMKERGIYVFGGKMYNPIKNEIKNSNELWICIFGRKPLQWVQPVCQGKPPSPRLYCSMNFYEKSNYLIIHGGRDEKNVNGALNDTYLFDLEKFNWIKIELYGNSIDTKVYNRCGHGSCIYKNKLIIFGGMNNNNYVGSSLMIVNLDFYYNIKMKTAEEVLMDELKKNNDEESRKQLKILKEQIKRNQLNIVKDVKLPPIE